MSKPVAFNYVKALERIAELEAEVARLKSVAYLCDGLACGDECHNDECKYTLKIEHAKNFKYDMGTYWETETND